MAPTAAECALCWVPIQRGERQRVVYPSLPPTPLPGCLPLTSPLVRLTDLQGSSPHTPHSFLSGLQEAGALSPSSGSGSYTATTFLPDSAEGSQSSWDPLLPTLSPCFWEHWASSPPLWLQGLPRVPSLIPSEDYRESWGSIPSHTFAPGLTGVPWTFTPVLKTGVSWDPPTSTDSAARATVGLQSSLPQPHRMATGGAPVRDMLGTQVTKLSSCGW